MFKKEIFDRYREMIENRTITPSDIQGLTSDFWFMLRRTHREDGIEAVKKGVSQLRAFKALFSKIKNNPDMYENINELLFQIGKFEGGIYFCDMVITVDCISPELTFSSKEIEYTSITVKHFLYENPDSRIKDICEKTARSKENVEQALLELQGMGIVEGFGCGENVTYALSVSAVKTVKEERRKSRLYDGYVGEPIFEAPNTSTYYDYKTDRQCTIPLRSREELKKELGLE